MSPEIEITIKVWLCYRCGHLWQRRRGIKDPATTCPECHSPYWNSRPKVGKKLLPLKFRDEEVVNSNYVEEESKKEKKK